MNDKIPMGVQAARVINVIFIALSVVVGLLMASIAVPNFIKAAQQAGGQAHPALLTIVGLVSFFIGTIPAQALFLHNKNLAELKRSARTWQIVISCLLLLAFPAGTVLSLVVLYFMLFDKKTKEAFVR